MGVGSKRHNDVSCDGVSTEGNPLSRNVVFFYQMFLLSDICADMQNNAILDMQRKERCLAK